MVNAAQNVSEVLLEFSPGSSELGARWRLYLYLYLYLSMNNHIMISKHGLKVLILNYCTNVASMQILGFFARLPYLTYTAMEPSLRTEAREDSWPSS